MKRLISIFMSAAIAFTSIVSSFPAYAEESTSQLTEQVQNTPKASGTGTVGTLLSEEINEELTEQQGNQGFNVFAAEVEENVVTITFEALEDCTLVTAVLDDAGEVLLYTESVDVLAGQTEAELTIAAEEMPQYFTLHAYLIDSDTFRPLCTVYECYTYTQEMQEFLTKTIEDFDQELVVSFDGSTDTNFGVFAEGTVILDYVEGVNTVASVDEENNVYVFENVDENITGLTAGTIMAYPYSDEIFLIVKVATVEVDGTTATVTGEETSLEEAFDYLRIETVSDAGDAIVDSSALEEGITYDGIIENIEEQNHDFDFDVPAEDKDIDGSIVLDKALSWTFVKKELGNSGAKLNGSIGIRFNGHVKFYLSFSRQYIEAKLDINAYADFSLTSKGKGIYPLSYIAFSPIPGVYLSFTPSVVVDTSCTIDIKASFGGTIGFKYENGEVENLSKTPTFDSSIKVQGSVYVGISLMPKLAIIGDKVAKVTLTAEVGGEAVGSLVNESLSTYGDKIHDCKMCLDGDINIKFNVSVEGKILNSKWLSFTVNLVPVKKIKLLDFYYRFDTSEHGMTTCPYIAYRINVSVIDQNKNPVKGATIINHYNNEKVETDTNGKAKVYVANGFQAISATHKNASNTDTYNFKVKNGTANITLRLNVIYDIVVAVKDQNGNPVAGATVVNLFSGEKIKTGSSGKATVKMPSGLRAVAVSHINATNTDTYNFNPGTCQSVTLRLNMNYPSSGGSGNNNQDETYEIIPDTTEVVSTEETSDTEEPDTAETSEVDVPDTYMSWEYIISDGEVTITKYTGTATKVVIPSEIGGYPVVQLIYNAFAGKKVSSIYVPASIRSLNSENEYSDAKGCFYQVEELMYVDVDTANPYFRSIDGVLFDKKCTVLYKYPECKQDTSYVISDSIVTVGGYAFIGNEYLEEIYMHDSILEIEEPGFMGCSSLKTIQLSDSLSYLPYNMFDGCAKLTSVDLPDSLTRIDMNAIGGSIQDITVPKNVVTIAASAFPSKKLISINVADENPKFCSIDGVLFSKDKTVLLEYPQAKGDIYIIPNGTKEIQEVAFSSDTLKIISVPDGVEKLGWVTFNCKNLESISIPKSVVSIDEDAFFPLPSALTIYGESGSYAETYAAEKGITFKNISEFPSEVSEVATSSKSSTLPEEFTHTTTSDTASFTGLTAGETYNFYVLRDLDAEAPLGSENLLYISQHVVGEDGTLSVTYKPLADDYNAVAFVEQMSPFDISSAEVTIPTIIANGSTRYIQPVVTLDGEALEIGADFEIGGDYPVIEAGTYTAVITGIGDYTGVINAEYKLLSEDNKSVDIAAVLSYPTKTAYAYGESLDLTGGVIEVYYNNDTFEEVPMTADMISGFDSTKTGAQTLTITYGELTAEYTVTVAEKTVTKPILTAKAGDGKVDLTWTAIDGATKYNVYIYTTGYKLLATVTDTSYTATGLTNGTKYGFLVRAFVNGAWTAFTTADNVYATPVAAIKPVVTATAGEGEVVLKWNALDGATNYRVFSYLNGKYAVLGETTATTYTASDLTAGTKYGFLVRALVNGAWTAFSNDDVVYATPTAAVVTKPEVTATAGDGKVDLTWNAIAGATKYNVYIYTTGYKLLTTTTETSYTATDLENGAKYGFLVRAFVNGAWTSFTAADNVYATPEAAVVTKPVVTATAGSGEVELEWNAVTGATSYNVFIYTTGYKLLTTTTETSYTATGLENGTKYGFLVRAFVNGAWTAFTTADNVYATPKAASTKPEFTATAGIGVVTLDWEPVEGATNYNVFTYLNGKYAVAGTTTDTTYTVTDLEAGTKYGFLVRAYVNNVWSPFTTADNVYATPTAALKPVLTVTAGAGSADLSWTAVAGATNYRVFSYLNGKYTEITVTSDTSCTATGLTSGTEYGFLVRAYVNNAWTAFSTADITYATIL